jgi:signal transduction histidine kinase/CheY-like chemotaxis protein
MGVSRWLDSWRRQRAPGAGALVRAAVSGASIEEIVRLAARQFLDAGQADRAGVWFLHPDQTRQLEGVVVEARSGFGKPEWERLDRSLPFLEMLLTSVEPVVVDLKKVPQAGAVGPLAKMRTAAWIPVRTGDATLGLALVAYSFTRLRVAPEVLRELADELALVVSERRARAESRQLRAQVLRVERLAALGQLISGVAHELNNPLTSIMGYAQLLLGRQNAGDRAEAHRLHEEAERARRIVGNLLMFAREAPPERRPVDVNEIVERTVALRSYELKLENILLERELAPRLPRVLADPHQVQQLVLNLLVNAEQAISSGGRADETGGRPRGRIRIRTSARGASRVVLEVTDDGPGIPAEMEARIFDPFFTTKPMGQGTGLGLSIARGIVSEHGGEIFVLRERSGGTRPRESADTTMVVELPALASEHPRMAEESRQPPAIRRTVQTAQHAATRRRLRVLVVEDEPTVAQLVADVLTDEGHRVETVLDSRDGLARTRQKQFDLVICDLRMPHLDGRGFYEALLREGTAAHTSLIFITGDTLAPRTLAFLEKYGLPYLAKPFLVEELNEIVARVMESPVSNSRRTAFDEPEEPAARDTRKESATSGEHPRREALRRR